MRWTAVWLYSSTYRATHLLVLSLNWTAARPSLNAIFIFLSRPDNQRDKLKSSICPRVECDGGVTMVLRHFDKYSSLIHNYQYFTLNRCFDVWSQSEADQDWPPCSVTLELSIKMPAFLVIFGWKSNFLGIYNLVLMLLVRVSVPFGEHQDSGCVYIGPTLKYSSPILSLDLSKNTGNGCCFPPAWTLSLDIHPNWSLQISSIYGSFSEL